MAKKKDIPSSTETVFNDIPSEQGDNTNDIPKAIHHNQDLPTHLVNECLNTVRSLDIPSQSDEKTNDWMELGAFWLSKSGKAYNGKLSDGTKVVLMINIYKKEPKHPDFRLFALPDSD